MQIVDRIPARRTHAGLDELLQTARRRPTKSRFSSSRLTKRCGSRIARAALKKADELLKIKPGHHRALEVQEDFARYGEGGIRLLKQFTRPWNDGGWIPWSALAFGLAVFGVMLGVVIIWLGKGRPSSSTPRLRESLWP